ncbi:MAG: arginine deiminase-related protein, partial [Steroidobacteraceae bacterium]
MNAMSEVDRQSAEAVLMIRPARFGANPETADSNRFQQGGADAGAADAARREFDGLVSRLRAAGVDVHVADDTATPSKPDACFPNNWVSFHADGSVVLYPLMAPSRRAERREAPIEQLREAGFRVTGTIDLSHFEARGEFLEGTGSLVLDRCHRVAYACISPRTTKAALADFSSRLGYRVVT